MADVRVQGSPYLLLVLLLWIASSSIYCAINWKRLYPPLHKNAVFYDSMTMAYLRGHWYALPMGFVPVAVAGGVLTARLGLPQSFLFFFGFFCRDIVVPRSSVRAVRYSKWMLLPRPIVEVDYQTHGGAQSIQLAVNDPKHFLTAMSRLSDDNGP